MGRIAIFLAALLFTGAVALAADPARQFSDAELIDGFNRTVFGAESGGSARDKDKVKKFAGPVLVHIVNLSERDRSAEVRQFLKQLGGSVRNLSFKTTRSEKNANMVVFLVDRADYRSVIEQTIPPDYDTRFLKMNDCSAVVSASGYRMDLAFVFLVVNETNRSFRHCLVEEITQSLGPVNDDWRLKNSIFNDYSRLNDFGVFDWYILNMLYDKRIKPGMSRADANKVLPKIVADTRRRANGAAPR